VSDICNKTSQPRHYAVEIFAFAHVVLTSLLTIKLFAEADLGVFGMFGRTWAPTIRGPHKSTNCQTAAAAIVVCIAARILNKMSMMTTVRVG